MEPSTVGAVEDLAGQEGEQVGNVPHRKLEGDRRRRSETLPNRESWEMSGGFRP
jgi:hypothetical protein